MTSGDQRAQRHNRHGPWGHDSSHVRLPEVRRDASNDDASSVDAWRLKIQKKSFRTQKVVTSRARKVRILKLLWCAWPVERLQSELQFLDEASVLLPCGLAIFRHRAAWIMRADERRVRSEACRHLDERESKRAPKRL